MISCSRQSPIGCVPLVPRTLPRRSACPSRTRLRETRSATTPAGCSCTPVFDSISQSMSSPENRFAGSRARIFCAQSTLSGASLEGVPRYERDVVAGVHADEYITPSVGRVSWPRVRMVRRRARQEVFVPAEVMLEDLDRVL